MWMNICSQCNCAHSLSYPLLVFVHDAARLIQGVVSGPALAAIPTTAAAAAAAVAAAAAFGTGTQCEIPHAKA